MKRAEEFARVRREFILGNSEELRTPLSVMKSSLWSMDTGDAGAGILVDMAKDAVTRMESKLDQLLSLCDVDMNETPLALEKMDAASLVEETMKAFIPELEEKGIMVRINDRSAGTEIFMDPSKIKIVLGNIVENSIRAVDRGGRIEMDIFLSGTGPGSQDGIELLPWNSDAFPAPGEGAIREAFHGYPELDAISKEISFQGSSGGPYVVIGIKDNGMGIPRGEIAGLSLPFRKSSICEDRDRPGIGLTVAQNIVSGHGGKILCESREGSGAAFSIWLPSSF